MAWERDGRLWASLGPCLGLALGTLGAAPALAKKGPPPLWSQQGHWTAFCDNSGGCGVANVSTHREKYARNSDANAPWICLWLGAADAKAASLSLRLDPVPQGAAGPERSAFLLQPVASPAQEATGTGGIVEWDGDERYILREPDLQTLIDSLRHADLALVRELNGGPVISQIPLEGLRTALRFAQAWQSAARPLPKPIIKPFIRAGASDMKRASLLLKEHCGHDPRRELLADAYHLAPDRQLWTISCRRTIYNAMTIAMTTTAKGRPVPLDLPSIVDHEGVGPDLSNLAVHAAFGVIEDYHKIRGTGDCGIRRRWGWTGSRFDLVSEEFMPSCFGAAHSQWLRMYATQPADPATPARPPC